MDAATPESRVSPVSLDLKRDKHLEVRYADGAVCLYTLSLLRTQCPCAECKTVRAEKATKKPLLQILPGNFTSPLSALGAELVGNYAIKIEWSDHHSSGIYSFAYLREICPPSV